MFCKSCGKQIDDSALYCPNCGAAQGVRQNDGFYRGPASDRPKPGMNALALVGFILSFFIPIAGLVLSIIGKKQIASSGETGNGFAVAGIIISSVLMGIELLVALGVIMFYLSIFAFLF